MAYPTSVPVARLQFADWFNYYGAETTLTVTATPDLPVPQITHVSTGETLGDGALIPAQPAASFDVPDPRDSGWVTPGGGYIKGWPYDVLVTISATGKPSLMWSGRVTPSRDVEYVTPLMGEVVEAGGADDTAFASLVQDPSSATGAAVAKRAGAEVHADFTGLPDGPVPTEFDTGHAFTYTATTPVIQGGAFTTPTTTTGTTATYLEPALGGKVTRVGAEFVIRRTDVAQTNGSLAMGAWSDPGVVATYPGAYPVAGAHFVINRERWTYNFYADTDPSDVASGTFTTPLTEGVAHRVELVFDGPRVAIILPDGSRATFTDPRADEHVDSRPFWEPFMNDGTGSTNVGITRVWADSVAVARHDDKYATAHDVAIALASRPVEASTVQWKPGDKYINLPDSTAPAVIDPNLYIDIVVPASKQFLITASAAFEKPGAAVPYWQFTANTSLTVGIVRLSGMTGTETITGQLFVDLSANGSFKAGNTVRIGWMHYKSGVDRVTMQVTNGRYPTMTVTPVEGKVVTTAG